MLIMALPAAGETLPDNPKEYTWSQRLRFFSLGLTWAVLLTMGPVAVTIWDMIQHYSDPVDWWQVGKLALASALPAAAAYWQKHKALLRVPPGLVIPDEFHPTKTTEIPENPPAGA